MPGMNGDFNGYSYLIGGSYSGSSPIYDKEFTFGIEKNYIGNDYVSLTTGRYLSVYNFGNNGDTYRAYLDYSINSSATLKALYSTTFWDGKLYNPTIGIRRVNTGFKVRYENVRLELLIEF